MTLLTSWLSAIVSLPLAVYAATYTIAQNHSGANFFDGWVFTEGIDATTVGNVLYQSQAAALQQQLAYVDNSGHAIIKVDNTTVGQGDTFGRASIKINSTATFGKGSLVILDANHLPYGCSVWPAYWSQGSPADEWPKFGEIDIIENVNMATVNQMALHTTQGCTLASGTQVTGTIVSNDCFNGTNGNQGCIVQGASESTYGAGFATAGGGVYALEWSSEGNGIRVWFFQRSSIPSDMASASPNPSNWGTPTAAWPESSCNSSQFFGPQTIILDITLCGNFAGAAATFQATCSGVCTDLIKTPSNYNNAYFDINYLRVFSDGTSGSNSGPTLTGTSSSSTATSTSVSSTNSESRTNAAASILVFALGSMIAMAGFVY
ncbi:unnamed protein product [Rhizoctonia solani]|uniref:GH16 domain-containing protein n=2 Tax=Rhizoctonia solani TaxID=456999 RepID=A0A8H3DPS8_9AGAM|nr:glycoside hydrolase family 16 protein [Rhizoctonia solani 123E]CAE6535199.1 unnamed protein product [Rhizoctonia solani]